MIGNSADSLKPEELNVNDDEKSNGRLLLHEIDIIRRLCKLKYPIDSNEGRPCNWRVIVGS